MFIIFFCQRFRFYLLIYSTIIKKFPSYSIESKTRLLKEFWNKKKVSLDNIKLFQYYELNEVGHIIKDRRTM